VADIADMGDVARSCTPSSTLTDTVGRMVTDAHPFDLTLGELRKRTSEKWQSADSDVLPLWVAEMDVMPAPAVAEVLQEALARGDTGYATGAGPTPPSPKIAGRSPTSIQPTAPWSPTSCWA
jgi:hypothetical protein